MAHEDVGPSDAGSHEGAGPPPGTGHRISQHLNHYVALADSKVQALVTAGLAIIGLLLTNRPAAGWPAVVSWVAVILLTASASTGGIAIYPRLPGTPRTGLIFWQDILALPSADAYKIALRRVDAADVEMLYADENYNLSRVLKAKYDAIRWEIGLFAMGIVLAGARAALN